jgi:hypothetical protein
LYLKTSGFKVAVFGFRIWATSVIHDGSEVFPRHPCLDGFGSRPQSGYAPICEPVTASEWRFPYGDIELASPRGQASIAKTRSSFFVVLANIADDFGEIV